MQPLAAASLVERVADGARFAFDNGWECRLFVLLQQRQHYFAFWVDVENSDFL